MLKMLNELKICLIVLLSLYSINLFGQKIMPFDSLVTIDISTIRKANEKLVELNYLRNTVSNQNDIISNYKELSEKQDSIIYNYQIATINFENKLLSAENINKNLNKSIDKKNKTIAILGGTTAASLIVTALCLLIR